ncbi:hypothetical protein [Mucilaginibacter sp. CSA2-8R]|uniref:hypothetical protein n=1 Tax=Mucilaginibacter sp. CSA2-8R TaxID=3141542 RepID=UPI00315CF88F
MLKLFKSHPAFAILLVLFVFGWLMYGYSLWQFYHHNQQDAAFYGLGYQDGLGNLMVLLSIFSLIITVIALLAAAVNRIQARFYLLMGACFVSPVLILVMIAFYSANI